MSEIINSGGLEADKSPSEFTQENVREIGSRGLLLGQIEDDLAHNRSESSINEPEMMESLRGEWTSYSLGEIAALTRAIEDTSWNIANPNIAQSYLKYGDDYGDTEYYTSGYPKQRRYNPNNNSRFMVFSEITSPSEKSAQVAIRLDTSGNIASFYGLEDSNALIPIVIEKVKTLPNNDMALELLGEKQELTRLCGKIESGEDLLDSELKRVYGIEGYFPTRSLEGYGLYNDEISKLKNRYDVPYALEHGVDPNELAKRLNVEEKIDNLDSLVSHGANIDVNELVGRKIDFHLLSKNVGKLIEHGLDLSKIPGGLNKRNIALAIEKYQQKASLN